VDVLRSQRMPGMEILVPVVDTRNTVAGPMSLPSASEVCRNLNRVYREPKQSNWQPKEDDVAALKEPPEEGASPTVLGYGESRGPGQLTEDLVAREPGQETEEDARTRRDSSFLEQMKRSAAEAARQNEMYDHEIGTHIDLTSSPRANNALKSSMVTPKVTREFQLT
jgi:hypothetical protein